VESIADGAVTGNAEPRSCALRVRGEYAKRDPCPAPRSSGGIGQTCGPQPASAAVAASAFGPIETDPLTDPTSSRDSRRSSVKPWSRSAAAPGPGRVPGTARHLRSDWCGAHRRARPIGGGRLQAIRCGFGYEADAAQIRLRLVEDNGLLRWRPSATSQHVGQGQQEQRAHASGLRNIAAGRYIGGDVRDFIRAEGFCA
jgi:hypothetical protein